MKRPAGDTTISPRLIIEVTSGSTAQTDRQTKHAAHTGLYSVQTCLVVELGGRRVSVCQEEGKRWT